jgi:hypothetical protein
MKNNNCIYCDTGNIRYNVCDNPNCDRKNRTLTAFIEGMQIFLKYGYGNNITPIHCEHDEMSICLSGENMKKEDIERLEKLGFEYDKEEDYFYSYRWGSC